MRKTEENDGLWMGAGSGGCKGQNQKEGGALGENKKKSDKAPKNKIAIKKIKKVVV
jgi:hypothetical protein